MYRPKPARYARIKLFLSRLKDKQVKPIFTGFISESAVFVNAMSNNLYCLTQMSTSVQQTMEDVALKPSALTRWAASCVPVYQDTPEMDSHVQVSQIKHYAFFLRL